MHSFPGFSRLRMHTKGGSPVAFVEYQDVRYAAQAMATLQGSFLLSSDRGAIRIEYAKSKMAEVGFTNLWIEVGFILCYASRYRHRVREKKKRKKKTSPTKTQRPCANHHPLHLSRLLFFLSWYFSLSLSLSLFLLSLCLVDWHSHHREFFFLAS